ncbi:MAG: penicillin-binding protein activator, partial [Alphaproteobacteria bacterium]|nr:penicillin-binding protein activator [Alphaproteobacteria bacterium]
MLAASTLLSGCGGGAGAPTTQAPEQPVRVTQPQEVEPRTPSRYIAGREIPGSLNYPDDAVRVGLLLPLTGQDAQLGQTMLRAAQLALFDAGEDRLVLMPRDTQGAPQGAQRAAEQLLADGVEVILGPLFSSSISAIAGLAQQAGVPVIGFSNDTTVSGGNVYLLGFTPEQQVERIVRFARAQGIRRFAALVPDNNFGERVLSAYRDTLLQTGGVLRRVERFGTSEESKFAAARSLANYDSRQQALQEERAALEALGADDGMVQELLEGLEVQDTYGDVGFEAVLIAAGGRDLQAVAPLLPYYDVDPDKVKFLGLGLWDDPTITREPSLYDAWFAAPEPAARERFSDYFEQVYGSRPPRITSLAYDAVALSVSLIRQHENEPFARRNLMGETGFAGIDGVFRFNATGIAERGLAVIRVTEDGLMP